MADPVNGARTPSVFSIGWMMSMPADLTILFITLVKTQNGLPELLHIVAEAMGCI